MRMPIYPGYGNSKKHYNQNNPRKSWEVCLSKHCKQLHNNRLWKCNIIAYLNIITDKYKLSKDCDWAPYLTYNGIWLEVSDLELSKFLHKEEELICNICSACITKTDYPSLSLG